MDSLLARGYSQLGMQHLHSFWKWVVPEGHPLIRDAIGFKWWHVALVSVLYQLVVSLARVVRFNHHPQPFKHFRYVTFLITAASLCIYIFILYEIGVYFATTGLIWTCHSAPGLGANAGLCGQDVRSSAFGLVENGDGSVGSGLASALGVINMPAMVDPDSGVELFPGSAWLASLFCTGDLELDAQERKQQPQPKQQQQAELGTAGSGKKKRPPCPPGETCPSPPKYGKKKRAGDTAKSKTSAHGKATRVDCTDISGTPEFDAESTRIADVLVLFHGCRAFFDFMINLVQTLTKPVEDLRTSSFVNEVRFSITHFIMWWLILLYEPGGEVLYSVATVCLFYLGTIACLVSQNKFIDLKMGLWVVIVLANSGRHAVNMWNGCRFPTALLAVSPPFDINDNIHMLWFSRWSFLPIGFVVNWLLFARGVRCNWLSVVVFFVVALWPSKSVHGETPSTALEGKKFQDSDVGSGELANGNGGHSVLAEDVSEGSNSKRAKPGQRLLRKCANVDCSHWEASVRQFNCCQRCRTPYCSRACQERDWDKGGHRLFCRLLRKRKLDICTVSTTVSSAEMRSNVIPGARWTMKESAPLKQ